MKLHALMIAAALAFAGTAFAQAPYGTEKAPADTGASMSSSHTVKAHKKHVAKVKHHVKHRASALRRHEDMHARARLERHHMHAKAHLERHEMHARAKMERHEMHARAHMEHNTRAMGAGPASPSVDLNSSARERRMDSAYRDWQRLQSRR